MAEFAKFYIDYLSALLSNIGVYFTDRWKPIEHIFTIDIKGYIDELTAASQDFGVGGWILLVLTTLINVTLIFFIVYRIVQAIRRFIFFRSKEVEKDELIEELAKTKEKVAKLTIEKNQLYAMKVNQMYGAVGAQQQIALEGTVEGAQAIGAGRTTTQAEKLPMVGNSRFHKLAIIDKKYEVAMPYISTAEAEGITLKQIVDNFINFAASQLKLYYKHDVVREFFAGMATTKVLILEGISGTGKTSLPYAMAKYFSNNATIVSVQPSWRDRADLLGYFNEFTKTFNETDFLGALYEATYKEDPSFVILDEMNLARIEYYFAEFLSIMEMPDTSEWLIDVVPNSQESDPKNLIDGKILVPQGLWFVGTANQDDSTFTITDKVYDRTVTIDLNARGEYFDAPITEATSIPHNYLDLLFQQAVSKNVISTANLQALQKIDAFILQKFQLTFGNRIMRQIQTFVPVYIACGGSEIDGIDFMLQSKILRKFSALNLPFLHKELTDLIALLDKLFGKNKCKMSTDFIKQLMRNA